MSQEPHEFFLSPGITSTDLAQALALPGELRFAPPGKADWRFFDTFDWRLYRRDLVLEERCDGDGVRCCWRELPTGRRLGELPGPVPRFAADLPPSPLRQLLEPLAEHRALLPRVTGHSRQEAGRWLNGDGKIVAHLRLESPELLVEGRTDPAVLPRRLSVLPLRGYAEEGQELGRRLRDLAEVTPAGRDLLEDALAAAGLEPGQGRGKAGPALTPELPAHLAVRQILLGLLDTMELNRQGTMAGWDTEFLHDFRVAVRRTRSALGQLRGIFPPPRLAHFRSEFGWLGAATGPVRDLDVYLLQFPAYQASLAEAHRDELAPLHKFLLQRHRIAQMELARALSSRRYRALVRDWRRLLADPSPGLPVPDNALVPILVLASARIGKLFARVLKKGRSIAPTTPAPALHELRITCKKLRYLLEFFAGLYPPEEVGRLIRELKILQDHLGTFQDLSVQGQAISTLAADMAEAGQAPVSTLLAMGMLVEHLEGRRQEVRQDFAACFSRFARKRNRALARLFEGHLPREVADP